MTDPTTSFSFWSVFIQQAPGIVGNIAIVVLFLRYGVAPLINYLQSRDAQWLQFYKEQGDHYAIALQSVTDAAAGISEEVKAGNQLIQITLQAIQQHDEWERASAKGRKRRPISSR